VAEIMGQRQCLGQILVQTKIQRQASGDLCHFKAVGQPGAEMVAAGRDKDLGFMHKPAQGGGMNNPVTVALKTRPCGAFGLCQKPSAARLWIASIRR